MAAAMHTGPELETKTNCQIGAELSDQAEVLADGILTLGQTPRLSHFDKWP